MGVLHRLYDPGRHPESYSGLPWSFSDRSPMTLVMPISGEALRALRRPHARPACTAGHSVCIPRYIRMFTVVKHNLGRSARDASDMIYTTVSCLPQMG